MAAETFAQYIRETRDPEGKPLNILAVCGSPAEAVEAAHQEAEKGNYDVILFTGSLYLIGAVRSILHRRADYDYYRTLKYGTEATDGSNR